MIKINPRWVCAGEELIVYGDTILPFLAHFNKESRY